MVEQKSIQVHDSTFIRFKKIKVVYQAEIQKELSDNEFVLELLDNIKDFMKLPLKDNGNIDMGLVDNE